MSSEGQPAHAILIFGKSAEPGKVKTRLHPFLTQEQCLELHLALLADAIAKARTRDADTYLYLAGPGSLPFDPGIPIVPQRGSDLGQRLLHAFDERLKDHAKVVIIGTDSPTLPVSVFSEAFRLLEDCPIVLGPAEDGGYYLIGLSRVIPEIFTGIDWGTGKVLQQTLKAAGANRVALLPQTYDIDTPEDLQRLNRELDAGVLDSAAHTAMWLRTNLTSNAFD